MDYFKELLPCALCEWVRERREKNGNWECINWQRWKERENQSLLDVLGFSFGIDGSVKQSGCSIVWAPWGASALGWRQARSRMAKGCSCESSTWESSGKTSKCSAIVIPAFCERVHLRAKVTMPSSTRPCNGWRHKADRGWEAFLEVFGTKNTSGPSLKKN